MLNHYVFLKYREDTPEAHIAEFCKKMLALKGAISELQYLAIERDELHEARSWSLLISMRFQTLDDLRAYQKHPKHTAVMQFNTPYVTEIGALDCSKPLPAP